MEKYKLVLRFLLLKEKLSENSSLHTLKVQSYNDEKLSIYFMLEKIDITLFTEILKIIDKKFGNKINQLNVNHYDNDLLYIELFFINDYKSDVVSIKKCQSCGYLYNAINYTYCYECEAYLK